MTRTRAHLRLLALLLALGLTAAACSDSDDPALDTGAGTTTTEAHDDGGNGDGGDTPAVAIASPADGASVAQRFDVEMAATAFTIEAAGEVADGAGHFHVMVDTDCVTVGETIPSDEQHLHFGKGQLRTQLFLEPGEHTLCLQAADGEHTALDLTDEITVTVDGDLPYVTLGLPGEEAYVSPLDVTFEAVGIDVAPVADAVEGGAHFHVMVDTDCVAVGETIPADDDHVHFGDGSLVASLELEPGDHTLCLQLGDNEHTALALTHWTTISVG